MAEISSFLERVADDMIGRFGSNFQKVAVVFNNQRPAQYLNHHLGKKLKQVFWSPQYFTIQEFIVKGSDKMELNAISQAFHLLNVYFEVQKHEKNFSQKDYAELLPLAELILQDFAQIDYELVPVEGLFQYLIEMGEIDRKFDYLTEEQKEYLKRFWSSFSDNKQTDIQNKFLEMWKKMPVIYEEFHERLAREGYATIPKIYRDLVEKDGEVEKYLKPFDAVLFVGFNALNACEKQVFKKWQDLGKAYFYFDVDEHFLYDRIQEAGLFVRENLGNLGLKNALGDPLKVLQNLEEEIEVIHAPGHTVQAKILKNLIEEKWGQAQGSKALILADESILLPLIQSLPKSIQVGQQTKELKYNITMGFPIRESNAYGLFSLFMEIQSHFQKQNLKKVKTVPQTYVLDYIVHPFVQFSEEIKTDLFQKISLISREEIPLLNVLELFSSPQIREFKSTKLAQRIFTKTDSIPEFLEIVENVWEHAYQVEHSEDAEQSLEKSLAENALQTVDQLREIFKKFGEISIQAAIRIIKRQIHQISTPLKGDPIQDIQIMGVLETRNLNFDHIILLGMNEGIMPSTRNPHSLIPFHIRKAFGMPVLENQNGLSAYLFYRLLLNKPDLSVVFNSQISESSSGVLSRFLHQLEFETQTQIVSRKVVLGGNNGADDLGVPLNQSVLKPIPKTGKVWEALSAFLNQNGRRLSASAFTAYLQSPLYFFIKYIAGVNEEPQVTTGLEKNIVGTLVHKIMELFYESHLKKQATLKPEDYANLEGKLNELSRKAFIQINLHEPNGARDEMSLEIAKRYAHEFLSFDKNTKKEFKIEELENEEDYCLDFPIEIQGEMSSVKLRGIIDRVDFHEGYYHIIDYKTGKDELMFITKENEETLHHQFFENFSFHNKYKAFIQTFFYTYIYRQVTGRENVLPHVYNLSYLRQGKSLFYFKKSHAEHYTTVDLQLSKNMMNGFEVYLKMKLEELFNPEIPFIHPENHQVFDGSPYMLFLTENMPQVEEDEI